MGEDVGWITGPHGAVKAVQKLIIDGEEYRKKIRELESKRECDIEVMRTAHGLLKDGAHESIVDTVWCHGEGNLTLWELLEMAIDGD